MARNPKPTPPVGTTFGLTVSQSARVSLGFTQAAAGRRLANTCQAPSKHNRRRPRCRRTLTRGSLAYTVQPGPHRLAFQGKIAGRRLPLGPYTLTIAATSTASAERSRPETLHFTIVR